MRAAARAGRQDGIRDGEVDGRTATTVHTARGELTVPLIVDALGWRHTLSNAPEAIQPPEARLSRGLEVHPPANGEELERWFGHALRGGIRTAFAGSPGCAHRVCLVVDGRRRPPARETAAA